MSIQDEAFARYHETHEGHVNAQDGSRDVWALDFLRANFLPHITDDFPGDKVLDIGCGDGCMLRAFRKLGFTAVGTDLDDMNVARTKDVVKHDVLKRPFKSVRFNIIVFMGVIEHIRKDDLLTSLRNIGSMLAPGGVLLITTQNMDSPLGDHYRYLDITHELGFTRESLCQVGRLAGFVPEAYKTVEAAEIRGSWYKQWVKDVWRWLYRWHVRVCGGMINDTWWDSPGLVGVWRKM